jgi:hypothetical protein
MKIMRNQNQLAAGQSRSYAIGLTVLSALGRLLPHVPNVTPVGASCLFAGSRINGFLSYLLPLVVMIATDPIVGAAGGAHSGYSSTSLVVYACFMINVWIGRRFVRDVTAVRVGGAAFLCSLQFFLLTNLAVWFRSAEGTRHLYARSVSGLLECYAAALPFWGRTLAGDLLFSAALFGIYVLLARRAAETANRVAA